MTVIVHKLIHVVDNAVNQRVLERSLKVKGYVTHVANHGQEALDFLKTSKLWKGNETSLTAPDIDVVLMVSKLLTPSATPILLIFLFSLGRRDASHGRPRVRKKHQKLPTHRRDAIKPPHHCRICKRQGRANPNGFTSRNGKSRSCLLNRWIQGTSSRD